MVNTLFLPELREMLAEHNERELVEFCTALHPARTAEFVEGLTAEEAWKVIQYAEPPLRAEIFNYFELDRQIDILMHEDEKLVAGLLVHIPADDAVDLLQELPENRAEDLLALMPPQSRRDIRRLQNFPEGTAGSVMTTEAACLDERLTVREALEALSREAESLETVYYIYVVDETNHLRGVVSTRKLVSSIAKQDKLLSDLMETDLVIVHALDSQEEAVQKVAHYNLLAIPVLDDRGHMLGIITHDDVIDVVREVATEDAQRIAAVQPLRDGYLRMPLLTLSYKRLIWLIILFFAELITAFVLSYYDVEFEKYIWLVWFIPLIISSGGNSGSQSATLIITALATDDVSLKDWSKIIRRELASGLVLGSFLAIIGLGCALLMAPGPREASVIPLTIMLVVVCGTLSGSTLPLIFKRIGWDPALMSNPFVAGIIDILGIVIYMTIAQIILSGDVPKPGKMESSVQLQNVYLESDSLEDFQNCRFREVANVAGKSFELTGIRLNETLYLAVMSDKANSVTLPKKSVVELGEAFVPQMVNSASVNWEGNSNPTGSPDGLQQTEDERLIRRLKEIQANPS